MKITQFAAVSILAVGLTGLAQAQTDGGTDPAPETPVAETPTEPAAETPAAPTDTADTAPTDPAEPAPAEPQVEVVTTPHGDWELRCTADKSDCFMYQLLQDAAGNPVAEFTLLSLPEGGQARAGVTVVTPLGTLLDPGLVLQIDGGQARKYTFTWCDRSGCFARFGLEPAQVDNYKRGNVARMRIISASNPEQPVDLNVSLSGFTAGFNEMEEALKAAVAAQQPEAPASE